MDCLIVFQPKDKTNYANRRRFLVSLYTLSNYIGVSNATVVRSKYECMTVDKSTILFRKYGRIDIYLK